MKIILNNLKAGVRRFKSLNRLKAEITRLFNLPAALATLTIKNLGFGLLALIIIAWFSFKINSILISIVMIAVPVALVVFVLYSAYLWGHNGFTEIHGTVINTDTSSQGGLLRKASGAIKGVYFHSVDVSGKDITCHINLFGKANMFTPGDQIIVYTGKDVHLRGTDYGYDIPSYITVVRNFSAAEQEETGGRN